MDPATDPAIFVNDLQDANKILSAYYFLKVHLHHFSKKNVKKVKKSRNQGFSYYFCMMIEASGIGSGFIPLTNGSGFRSRRPKTYGSGSATLVSS
jgi:hypothetical protein